jgi:hypothetical protein
MAKPMCTFVSDIQGEMFTLLGAGGTMMWWVMHVALYQIPGGKLRRVASW